MRRLHLFTFILSGLLIVTGCSSSETGSTDIEEDTSLDSMATADPDIGVEDQTVPNDTGSDSATDTAPDPDLTVEDAADLSDESVDLAEDQGRDTDTTAEDGGDVPSDTTDTDSDAGDLAADRDSGDVDAHFDRDTAEPDLFDPCEGNPCTETNRTMCARDGMGGYVCSCDDDYQDNDENGTCLPDCATANPDCHGRGSCDDGDGVAVCDCVHPWAGNECTECAPSYELDTDVCLPLAEYVVKELSLGGRYTYRPTSPRPSNIRDEVWAGYPFRGIDSAFRLETLEGYWAEGFTYGNQYILLHDGAWKTCPNSADCSSFVPGPGPLCPSGEPDDFWGADFPFCDGIDSMTQLGAGPNAIWAGTYGTQYVQWSIDDGYHNTNGGTANPGPGIIGDSAWGAGFPFTEIDAMVDYYDDDLAAVRILFVSGRQAVNCSDGDPAVCMPAFEIGSPDDTFFPHLWQTLPFAEVPERETPVDAMIRSGSSGRAIYIASNTPLPREETTGELRIYDSISGPQQRALVLPGSSYEQGHTQGYLLGEEIVAVINEIMIPFYNEHLEDPVTIAGGKTGYEAVRELVSRFDFSGDLAVYIEELEGMVDGIEDNLVTNMQLYDGDSHWPLDLTDLIAMQLVDDLWGTHCKSATVWPEGGVTVAHPFHISVIDWDTALGPYNLLVAYDNSGDDDRMSWIGPSWSGNTTGFLFGLNEAGAMASYVSSGGELRRCPDTIGLCLDRRFADLDGMTLSSTGFLTRRSFELAATVDEAWALFDGVTAMTVSSFAMTEPTNGKSSGVVFEIIYPGIAAADMWGSGHGYTFNPTTRPGQFRRYAPEPDVGDFVPVLASVAPHLGIVDIPGGESFPAYVALRDGLTSMYPAGVDTTALIDLVHDGRVFTANTTQITIGEAIVGDGGNESVIDVFFSGLDGHNVWGDGASHGRYTWTEILGE